MKINDILNKALDLILVSDEEPLSTTVKWKDEETNKVYYIEDIESFNSCIKKIIHPEKELQKLFALETINEFIIERIQTQKRKAENFETDMKSFFKELHEIEPDTFYVKAHWRPVKKK